MAYTDIPEGVSLPPKRRISSGRVVEVELYLGENRDKLLASLYYKDGALYIGALGDLASNENFKFVKENDICKVCSYNGSVFSVEPPMFVELEITDTEPGFKGDTATGASKPATVETGAQISVPLFVNIGDKVKIDTRTGEYLSRV